MQKHEFIYNVLMMQTGAASAQDIADKLEKDGVIKFDKPVNPVLAKMAQTVNQFWAENRHRNASHEVKLELYAKLRDLVIDECLPTVKFRIEPGAINSASWTGRPGYRSPWQEFKDAAIECGLPISKTAHLYRSISKFLK